MDTLKYGRDHHGFKIKIADANSSSATNSTPANFNRCGLFAMQSAVIEISRRSTIKCLKYKRSAGQRGGGG
jgi:hypothetical protein